MLEIARDKCAGHRDSYGLGNSSNQRQKRAGKAGNSRVEFIEADSQALPFEAGRFQCVTVAFGLRNVANTDQGLREMVRVCRPGGQVLILEFSQPRIWGLKQTYGFYFRNVTELLLFGVKGSMRTLQPGRTQVNLVAARKQEHSRKPEEIYRLIESCSPGPYLELFARERVANWTQWGDELDTYLQTRPIRRGYTRRGGP